MKTSAGAKKNSLTGNGTIVSHVDCFGAVFEMDCPMCNQHDPSHRGFGAIYTAP